MESWDELSIKEKMRRVKDKILSFKEKENNLIQKLKKSMDVDLDDWTTYASEDLSDMIKSIDEVRKNIRLLIKMRRGEMNLSASEGLKSEIHSVWDNVDMGGGICARSADKATKRTASIQEALNDIQVVKKLLGISQNKPPHLYIGVGVKIYIVPPLEAGFFIRINCHRSLPALPAPSALGGGDHPQGGKFIG